MPLAPLYEAISRTAIQAIKPEHVATFLGRRLTGSFSAELGNDFNTRIQGTRLRPHRGPATIKMYDPFGRVLRIETTTHDVSFFKHHRSPLGLHSLSDLAEYFSMFSWLSAIRHQQSGLRSSG